MKKSWKDYAFVITQFLLLGMYAFEFSPIYVFPAVLRYVGLVLAIAGFIVAVVSLWQIRKSFTAFPTPATAARLITSGMFKFSRHPIYTGIILFLFGYGFFHNSNSKLILAVFLVALFYVKTIYEEEQLVKKFANYSDYKKTVNRFFPTTFQKL